MALCCGGGGGGGEDVDPELAKKNADVGKNVSAAKADDAKIIKMLLLGAGAVSYTHLTLPTICSV